MAIWARVSTKWNNWKEVKKTVTITKLKNKNVKKKYRNNLEYYLKDELKKTKRAERERCREKIERRTYTQVTMKGEKTKISSNFT